MRRGYVTVPNADIARVQESARIAIAGLSDVAWGEVITVTLADNVPTDVAHGLGSVPRALLLGAPDSGADIWETRSARTSTTVRLEANVFSGGSVTFDFLVF